MAYLVEYKVNETKNVMIEVEGTKPGFENSYLGFDVTKTNKKFEEIISNFDPSLNILYEKIRNINHKPKNVSIEFGLKINGDCQAFIASTGMAAQFKITITWEGIA